MASSKMQISSLISPQDVPGSGQSSLVNGHATSPKRKSQPRSRAPSLVQQAVTSPRHFNHDHPTLPHNAVALAQFMPSPSSTSPSTAGSAKPLYSALGTQSEPRGSMGTLHLSPQMIARLPATPMDTLAGNLLLNHLVGYHEHPLIRLSQIWQPCNTTNARRGTSHILYVTLTSKSHTDLLPFHPAQPPFAKPPPFPQSIW